MSKRLTSPSRVFGANWGLVVTMRASSDIENTSLREGLSHPEGRTSGREAVLTDVLFGDTALSTTDVSRHLSVPTREGLTRSGAIDPLWLNGSHKTQH